MAEERLQKILASAGLGSRRSCEALILQGRVSVDGKVVTQLGTKADPAKSKILCDGELVRPEKKLYMLINKPVGYVCTNRDELGRPRVFDLLRLSSQRLFTVGRLDADTQGLLIVTNDGDFAQRVAHPRHGVSKTYHARVRGTLAAATRRELTTGVWIGGHRCRATSVKTLKQRGKDSLVAIVMREGRNREVRRMLAKVGHKVVDLQRVCIGPIEDEKLQLGKARKLRPTEVKALIGEAKSPAPRSRA